MRLKLRRGTSARGRSAAMGYLIRTEEATGYKAESGDLGSLGKSERHPSGEMLGLKVNIHTGAHNS